MDGKHNTDKTNVQMEFQDGDFKGIQTEIKFISHKSQSPHVAEFVNPPNELIRAFSFEIPLANQISQKIGLLVKLYNKDRKMDCDNEVKAWGIVRKSPYFHYVPPILPYPYKFRILSGSMKNREFFGFLMEKAQGRELDTWFNQLMDDVPNPPIAFHQFFGIWFQLFQFLRFVHLVCDPHLYHSDIKPNNIIFSNNSLRLIDLNASTTHARSSPYGALLYAPNIVIEGARKDRMYRTDYEVHTGFFDLYCAGMTLLELFTTYICMKCVKENKNQLLNELSECFAHKKVYFAINGLHKGDGRLPSLEAISKKAKISIDIVKGILDTEDGKYFINESNNDKREEKLHEKLKQENIQIRQLLEKWRSQSIIGEKFSLLLNEEFLINGNDQLLNIYNDLFSKPKKDYIEAAMKDIKFEGRRGTLHTALPKSFPKLLSKMLTNYSRNLFSYSYPFLYLDYSNNTMGYDEQAKLALKSVNTYAKSLLREKCLDVGCAFGTAALHASKWDFQGITCLDNNPYFHRLAGLLWNDDALTRYNKYFPKVKELFVAIYGDDGEQRLENLIRQYNSDFLLANKSKPSPWVYWVADYWFLAIEEMARNKFDLIICNNFLHWPVIDFQNMNEECSDFYEQDRDLGTSYLEFLLFPLLSHLKKNGCLVIVEPSQFFEDDYLNKDKDTALYEKRFTNQPIYEVAQNYARSTLAARKDTFGFELKKIKFRERDNRRFLSSSFFKVLEPKGYSVDIIPEEHSHRCDWRRTIIGEFNMTLRNLTDIEIQEIYSDEVKLIKFYELFRKYLEELDIPPEPPLETIYITVITKN